MERRKFLSQTGKLAALAWIGRVPTEVLCQEVSGGHQRRVWLRLLLEMVEQDVRAGRELSEQKRFLAGLTGVRHIYLDEERRDLILEGPAEDRWQIQADGSVLGETTGQPLLQLDDFAVAWRNTVTGALPPSVSLEHRRESVERIQQIIRGTPHPTTAAARAEFTQKLQQAWGPQDAVTGGVPTNTRFNQVMVEADWEMKRISLGLVDPGVEGLPTYIDLEFRDLRRRVLSEGVAARKPDGGSRFWFFPAYAEFTRTEKFDAVEVPGDPVQLLTESHFRNLAQGRQITQEPSPAAMEFVAAFTRQFSALSLKNPLFADLRNLFDWVAVSRVIHMMETPRRLGWDLGFLRQGFPVSELNVPGTKPGQIALRHAEVKTKQGLASLAFPARGGVSMDVRPMPHLARAQHHKQLERRAQNTIVRPPAPGRFWT